MRANANIANRFERSDTVRKTFLRGRDATFSMSSMQLSHVPTRHREISGEIHGSFAPTVTSQSVTFSVSPTRNGESFVTSAPRHRTLRITRSVGFFTNLN